MNEKKQDAEIYSAYQFYKVQKHAKQLYVLLTGTNLCNNSINHAIQGGGWGVVSGRGKCGVSNTTSYFLFLQKVKA